MMGCFVLGKLQLVFDLSGKTKKGKKMDMLILSSICWVLPPTGTDYRIVSNFWKFYLQGIQNSWYYNFMDNFTHESKF